MSESPTLYSPGSTDTITLSVVVPMFNESLNLGHFCREITHVLDPIKIPYEIIFVNDGSKDDSLKIALTLQKKYKNIAIIDFSRNFGKEIALTAGLDFSRGEAVVPIDADLQDPPGVILELLKKWQEGFDVVCAVRKERLGETWLKKFTASSFYKIIGHISEIPIPENVGDFRLLDRKVVESLKQLPERTRFMKGLFAWVGYRQTIVYFERPQRWKGQTKWNYWKLWNFALDGITAFSSLPLKIWSYLGIFIACFSLLYALFLVVKTVYLGVDVPGYASLMVATLFLGSIQLIAIGVIGEYLSRIYAETKQRPLYVIRKIYSYPDH